jgi:hypothetical protein
MHLQLAVPADGRQQIRKDAERASGTLAAMSAETGKCPPPVRTHQAKHVAVRPHDAHARRAGGVASTDSHTFIS